MELNGNYFKFSMEVNEIMVKGKRIMFSNRNDATSGYIFSYTLEEEAKEEMHFVLNKKDYETIAHLGSFEINMKGDLIKIKSGKIKINMSNMTEYVDTNVSFKSMKQLDIDFNDLLIASKFVGNDNSKLQTCGVNIKDGNIVSSDTYFFYEKRISDEIEGKINIPFEVFKRVPEKAENVVVKIKENMIDVIFDGIHFYSALYGAYLPDMSFGDEKVYTHANVNRIEFVRNLKLIKKFDQYVNINFSEGAILLKGKSETEDIAIMQDAEIKNMENIDLWFDINKLLTIINITDDERIDLNFIDNKIAKIICVDSNGGRAVLLPVRRN